MFKQLPTMISELNKLGIVLKSLDGMNLATVGVNTGNLDAFRSAIKCLSTEQAVFALASKGATEEQIKQILITKQSEAADVEAALAKAGLTTATAALNGQEVIELAQKKGITSERAKEIATALGLIATEEGQVVSKKQLTVATLKQAGATDTEIASILGLNAAETANIGITNILTGAVAKLWAVITAHPIGAILTAVGAVAVGVIAYINKSNKDAQKAIVETHEKAQQTLDDTKTALSDDKSELESVNSELDSTKQKIQDMASQGTITLTEQNELDKLSTANTQLETQKSLLENNIKLKQKSAALDAKNLLDTQVEMDYSDIQDGKDIVSHKESYTYAEHAEYEASSLKNAYNIYMSALRDGDAEKQKIAQELIDAAGGDTAELTSSLLEIVESFKYDDGTIVEGYEDLYNQYMGLIYNLQSLTNPEMFLDIAKQATEGTNIDYEKAISDGYAMAYDGEFDIDKLNQDFVKVLADNGIDESTIEYIFKLKQQEYQSVVDNINKKYNPDNVLTPTYLTEPGHADTKEETTQKQLDYEQQKQEVQNINDELTKYAKEHPIEFQLISSYDENFSTLDKYIEEEKSKSESAIQDTKSQLEDLSKNGNVDLTIRPVIDSSAMQAAGWDVEDGSIATTFTQGEFIWQGDEENGQYVYVHYTPILPDGTVLTPDQLSDYLYGTLEGSQNILDADDKGLVLKVDTDLQGISEDDIKALQEDGKQSAKMSNFLNQMGQWDDSLHDVQEGYYLTGDSVDYVNNAVNRLVDDAKKAKDEISNGTPNSFIDTLNSSKYKDIKEKLLDLAKSGEITPETLSSTEDYNTLLTTTGTSAEDAMNQILDMLSAQEKLSGLSQGLDKLKSAYEEFKDDDIGFVTAKTLESLPNAFKNLPQFDIFEKIVGNPKSGAEKIQQAFNDIVKAYLLSQNTLNGLVNASSDEVQSYIANLKQMGITNAEELVEQASTVLNSENDMLNKAEQEYSDYLEQKDGMTLEYVQSATSNNGKLVTALGSSYKSDYDNWCDLLKQKGDAYNKFIDAINGSYDPSKSLVANMQKNGQTVTANTIANASAAQSEYLKTAQKYEDMKNSLKIDLAPINTNFSTSYSPSIKNSGSDKNSTKDKTETVETFNFIETAISNCEKSLESFQKKAESTFRSLNSRTQAYANAISKTTEEINLQNQAYAAYMAKANSYGLAEGWAVQVRNGSINIADVSDETLKNQISNYQTWYEKAKACKEKISELKETQAELTRASIQVVVKHYEDLAEKAEEAIDSTEKWISLKEAWGGSASIKDYSKMNSKIQEQIKYINKQNEQLTKLRNTTKKGSESWYEYNQQITSNSASLRELTQQMQENATAAAALAKTTADKKIEKYDSKDELYDAKAANEYSSKSKNKWIDKKISNLKSRQNAYNTAVTDDTKNLNSSKKTISKFKSNKENKKVLTSIKKVVKYGKRISTDLLNKASKLNDNGKLYNACVKYNAYLDAKDADKTIADLYKETSKQDKASLAKEKFDNISNEYEYKRSSNENKKNQINNKIEKLQSQGRTVNTGYYHSLITIDKSERKQYLDERNALQKELNKDVISGKIKKGSQEWYDMVDAINEANNKVQEFDKSIIENQNNIRQLKWDTFDKSLETVKRINSEADYYINLMSNKDLVDEDTGKFTKYGSATLGLHKTNYDSYLAQANQYQSEYNSIMKQIKDGELSLSDENVIARLRELQDAHRDAKESAENELQSMKDLVKQGYDAQINSLSKLIDKYKKLRDSEKDAYEYQRNIEKQIKSISDLQKQLTAFGGNDSEESRAQIQKLKVELQDATDELRDTQYDHFISDTESMLDNLMNNYQEFIDEKLNDTNSILGEIKSLLGNDSDIVATLKSLDAYLTTDLQKLITGNTSASNLVSNTVANDKKEINKKASTATYDASTKASDAKEKADAVKKERDELNRQIKNAQNEKKDLENYLVHLKSKYDAEKKVTKNKTKLSRLKAEYESEKMKAENEFYKQASHIRIMQKQLDSLPKYAKGSKHINKDGLAITQDNGSEMIYRAADGSILHPLGEGDMVFTNEMSENLWKLAQMNPSQFGITSQLTNLPDMTRNVRNSGNTTIQIGDIKMEGVNDVETFGRQLREEILRNGKTTQCITEAVSAKQLGRNGIGNARLYK